MSTPSSGRGRRRIGALTVLLAVFALVALRSVMLAGPALNSDLRVAGPWEDWRASTGIALYYQNLYLREQAFQWLQVAAETRDEEGARKARDLLRRSLAIAPANAFAWNVLGWSELVARDVEGARAAIFASWRLAPYSADLSISRLLLASSLAMEDDAAALPAILRDLRVARRTGKGAYAALLATRPRLKPLADTLEEEAAAPE